MDRLTAFVAIAQLRLRLDIVQRHPHLLEDIDMNPKLKGVASAMAKLQHSLEERSGKLLDRIESADKRGANAFDKAHASLDVTEKAMGDVEAFISSLEGSNGGPTLGDSSDTSDRSQLAEPAASWGGLKS